MSKRYRKPNLINVNVIPWEGSTQLYGLVCDFDDGISYREPWGAREETEYAASLRRRDIVSPANLRRTSS